MIIYHLKLISLEGLSLFWGRLFDLKKHKYFIFYIFFISLLKNILYGKKTYCASRAQGGI